MKRIVFTILWASCTISFLGGCRYFSETAPHDQAFAEKLVKTYMSVRYNEKYYYVSTSFGPIGIIKDSIINVNSKKVSLKGHGWREIENHYVLKDDDGKIISTKSSWFLIDSTLSRTTCCIIKK